MKRILSLLLVLLMITATISVVTEGEEFTFTVGTVNSAENCSDVTVPVYVSGNTGFSGAIITIDYDPALTLTSVTPGVFSELIMTPPGDYSQNPVKIVFDGIKDDKTESGILANLSFKAPLTPGTYPIKLTYSSVCNYDLDDLYPAVVNGAIVVPEPTVDVEFEGAQIRTEGVQGLRFIFSISKETYESLSENERPDSAEDVNAGFGAVVFPRAYLGDNSLTKGLIYDDGTNKYYAKTVPAVKLFGESEDGTRILYTVCMTDIPVENYTAEYVVVPYITLEGGELTSYGKESEGITVFSVAEAAYSGNEETAETREYLYNNILTKVDENYGK